MAEAKTRNAIGLAMKAGRIVSGDFAAEKTVRAGNARLILLDAGVSDNTREKYEALAKAQDIGMFMIADLGACIGKPGRMVAAVTDDSFTNMIMRASRDLTDGGVQERGGKG